MTEDFDFISNVRALSGNATLAELLRRIDEDAVAEWRIATDEKKRERCWYAIQAIERLSAKILSFNTDEKVRHWQSQRAVRRI